MFACQQRRCNQTTSKGTSSRFQTHLLSALGFCMGRQANQSQGPLSGSFVLAQEGLRHQLWQLQHSLQSLGMNYSVCGAARERHSAQRLVSSASGVSLVLLLGGWCGRACRRAGARGCVCVCVFLCLRVSVSLCQCVGVSLCLCCVWVCVVRCAIYWWRACARKHIGVSFCVFVCVRVFVSVFVFVFVCVLVCVSACLCL